MKNSLLILLSLISLNLFSQDLITPILTNSFGLNHHTNRDISYFSHTGTDNSTYIVGTTENDSTFTDIIITKIDQDYNLLWQHVISQPTNLSYDIPEKSFLNSNGELCIIGRNSLNQSYSNGLIFVLKFDQNGNIIYNLPLGNIDGSDYRDYNYMNADLNNDGTLSLVYDPTEYNSPNDNTFNFIKIGNFGNIIESNTHQIPNNSIIGIIKNEEYYFLSQVIDSNYDSTFNFYKIDNQNNLNSLTISNPEFQNFYAYVTLSQDIKLTLDENNNFYISHVNLNGGAFFNQINMTKINTNNEVVYSLSSSSQDLSLIGVYNNANNDNIALVNNNSSNTFSYASVINNNSIEITPYSESILATGFKENNDDTFFITTSNSHIKLFSDNLTELSSFNTSDDFELIDFSKVDNNTISVIGTTYSKMFPTSDYYTQLDIKARKINTSQEINEYTFSGIGTSRAFQQRIIIDNDNNYLVLATEKMGPEYLGIGGANPPINQRIIKYDQNLSVIWEITMPNDIFNLINHNGLDIDYFIDSNNNLYLHLPRAGNYYGLGYSLYKVTPNGNLDFINDTYVYSNFHADDNYIFLGWNYFLYEDSSQFYLLDKENGNLITQIDVGHEEFLQFFTIGNDYYFYTFESVTNNTPDYIYLYKNGIKQWTRSLSNNYGIIPNFIDEDGTLFFATRNPPLRKLNKLDRFNNFSSYNTNDEIIALKQYENGNIFLFLDNDETLILSENLDFVSNGDTLEVSNVHLMSYNNYILLGTYYDKNIRVIDNNGNVIDHFYLSSGNLHNWYSKFDNLGKLIIVGQKGNRISTFNEYSWARGFIHVYGTIDNLLSIKDFDTDNSINSLKIVPNPVFDKASVILKDKTIKTINLYDLSGKKIKSFDSNVIDLKNLESGIYTIKVITSTDDIYSSKIIKN